MDYYIVGEPMLQETAKPLLEVIENGKTVDLGDDLEESDKYINVRLRNIIKNFNNDTQKFEVFSNYFRLHKCNAGDFERNKFDREYWEFIKSKKIQYCVSDNEKPFLMERPNDKDKVFLKGTRDSLVLE